MAGTSQTVVRVADVIDSAPVGRLQISLFTLLALCLILAGFDVQVVGFVAPTIFQEWGVPRSALGNVLAAGNFGILLGSLLFTMLADKIGRRPVLLAATIFFAVLTLMAARVESVRELTIVRFIAGLGLGCIIPNATALIGEYSPRRLRVTFMACISVGFTGGAALAGFVSAWLIPEYGWRAVFYFGGFTPLLVVAFMFVAMPESLQFLVLRKGNRDKVAASLQRIDPSVPAGPNVQYVVQEEKIEGVPALHLFREGRGPTTILLWIVNFMNIYNLYVLAGWLPTIAAQLGYSAQTSVYIGTVLQVGGLLGTFWLTWFIGRWGFVPVLTMCFVVACASIAMIGQPGLALWLLFSVVFIAGSCIIGGQPMINSMAAMYYPTYLRSTGIGWGLGVGRAGAIIGPLLVGRLLAANWSVQEVLWSAAIPAIVSAVAMLALHWVMKPARTPAPAAAVR